MPFDAVLMRGVVQELQGIVGLRVEKLQQPTRDQVVLSLRGGKRLLLSAGASQARIHLTHVNRENPAAPPMFCMLLRKHLGGGRIAAIEQSGLERVVSVSFDIVDELGEPGRRKLVLECIGPRSNLILLDGQERIIDCLRRVDLEMSEKRQVLPGLFYRLPPAQDKLDPLTATDEDWLALLNRTGVGVPLDKTLLDGFFGLSPLVCRELAHRAGGESASLERLKETFSMWREDVKEGRFTPWLLLRDGKPFDFSYLPIHQYGSAAEGKPLEDFSTLLDGFYETRERQERLRQKGQDLQKCAATARDRLKRKLAIQEKEYRRTQDRDKLRANGELITANLYRMERGQRALQCTDYSQEGCPEVTVPLDPLLTPQQNAAKYFKQYNKSKTAERVLAEQMDLARRERDYLESVLFELSRAETEQDFNDIRAELREAGYWKASSGRKKAPKQAPGKPRTFRSSGGFRILVGRNNTQNDALTKNAAKTDYWFHTQHIHGAHVILCAEGREPDPQSMTEAAALAAYFSQGRDGTQVAVDYTQARNVKKPAGARPGMAVYTPYRTAYVTPDPVLVEHLRE